MLWAANTGNKFRLSMSRLCSRRMSIITVRGRISVSDQIPQRLGAQTLASIGDLQKTEKPFCCSLEIMSHLPSHAQRFIRSIGSQKAKSWKPSKAAELDQPAASLGLRLAQTKRSHPAHKPLLRKAKLIQSMAASRALREKLSRLWLQRCI